MRRILAPSGDDLRRAAPLFLARGRAALLRHLAARAARFRKADGDRLLAARDLLAGAAATQRAVLALVHRALHLALGLLSVSGHCGSSDQGLCPFGARPA